MNKIPPVAGIPKVKTKAGYAPKESGNEKAQHDALHHKHNAGAGPSTRSRKGRKRNSNSSPPKDGKTRAAKKARNERLRMDHRAAISKELGREANTDDEREYDKAEKERLDRLTAEQKAHKERSATLSPEERRNEDAVRAVEDFRQAIAPRLRMDLSQWTCELEYYPRFILQEPLERVAVTKCHSAICANRLSPAEYIICVSSGKLNDTYHVQCFEELLDLSSARYMIRFEPDVYKHVPDRGAQDIFAEYIARWRSRIEQAEKASNKLPRLKYVVTTSNLQSDPDQELGTGPGAKLSLLLKDGTNVDVWGIADEIWEKRREHLAATTEKDKEEFDRSDMECDEMDLANSAEGDDRSWCITKYLLDETSPEYNERHALSQALEKWTADKKLADPKNSERLNEVERTAKEALGELTIKRIQRYAVHLVFATLRHRLA